MRIEDVLGDNGVPPDPSPKPRPAPIVGEVTPDMLRAHDYCFVSGAGGTGKTWLARELAQDLDTLLCATTGIAAVNLGDAVTIHSQLGFHDKDSLLNAYASRDLHARLRNLVRMGYRRIVLDEVSMLSADSLTHIVDAIEEVAKTKQYDADLSQVVEVEHDDRRIALVLIGDFAQLSPIEEPYAFESTAWPYFEEHTYKLETVRRQTDPAYIKALMHVRKGEAKAALEILGPRFTPRLDLDNYQGTTIVAKNDEVDRINKIRHAKLTTIPFDWPALRSGEQRKEWVNNIPNTLSLKPGALVMILANRYEGTGDERRLLYANGETGEVIGKVTTPEHTEEELAAYEELGMDPPAPVEGIKVFLTRTMQEVTVAPITREWKEPYKETDDEKADREALEQKLGKKVAKPKVRVKGMITYMPLRLAYATTVHKSQGLTLDRVQIAIAGNGSWMFEKPGMTYVALSRCRTLEGLTIVGSPRSFLSKCAVNPKVRGWL